MTLASVCRITCLDACGCTGSSVGLSLLPCWKTFKMLDFDVTLDSLPDGHYALVLFDEREDLDRKSTRLNSSH